VGLHNEQWRVQYAGGVVIVMVADMNSSSITKLTSLALDRGKCGGTYADAVILLSSAVSAVAADLWPGPRLNRRRWIRWLVIASAVPVALAAQAPERLAFDRASTSIVVHVGRSGVFGFAGHDHEIAAPVADGQILVDRTDLSRSTITAVFDATALRVTGKGEPADDVPVVQRVMLSDRVLDVEKYPKITFRSGKISATQRSDRLTLRVDGELTLHGITRPLSVPVDATLTSSGLTATGRVTVRQTDFGIRPVTAGAGTVRVKDEVDVVFSIVGRPQ
jgi:polyisoprenoid-binding protein YceI